MLQILGLFWGGEKSCSSCSSCSVEACSGFFSSGLGKQGCLNWGDSVGAEEALALLSLFAAAARGRLTLSRAARVRGEWFTQQGSVVYLLHGAPQNLGG